MLEPPRRLVAIYPGSFDPITNGHLDLIERAARLVDKLFVSILHNEKKQPLFSIEERMQMAHAAIGTHPIVEVDTFGGLLVDHATAHGATLIIRGIRAISDYEFEWQMALMNRRLQPKIETMFLMAGETHSYVSSHLVKEVARLGGNISGLVPGIVETKLKDKLVGVRT